LNLLRQKQQAQEQHHENRNLAARRWWYIMPIVFITYSLAYLDRANYGFAAASAWPRT
jgi:sugar phosphate permease